MAAGRPSREAVYRRLDIQIAELWTRMGGLPSPDESEGIWRGIWFEEAHHSTALEGNTLVLKQVEQLLAEGKAVGDKQLSEYMEVKGYADAAAWVYGQGWRLDDEPVPPARDQAGLVTLTELRQIHQLAMQPVWDVAPHPHAGPEEGPGGFRRHDIQPFPGGMTPPTWPMIPAEIDAWLESASTLRARVPGFPDEVAGLHSRFEQIHPFLDGNGRTGRLVLNLVLVRLGYPPAVIYKSQRAAYLSALRRADSGDAGALGELIARAVLDNLYRFVLPAVAGPAKLVPLVALATPTLNATALRVAAVRGALQATKGPDGQWRSSRNWVDEYVRTKHRRR